MCFGKSNYFSIYKLSQNFLLLILIAVASSACKTRNEKVFAAQYENTGSENALNINTATAAELEKLPRVGQETAKNIIVFREKYGKFRRAENLILVHGMSDKKFRNLRNSVVAE